MPLNLLQRISTREVRGRVLERRHFYMGTAYAPVTTYTIKGDNGKIYGGAIDGHQPSPREGDYVEMYLARRQVKLRQETLPVKVSKEVLYWEQIKGYRVLEPKASS